MRVVVRDIESQEIIKTLNNLNNCCIALDTETHGLKWNDTLFALQLCVQGGDTFYFNFNTYHEKEKAIDRQILEDLHGLWSNSNITWVMANAKFDMRRLEIEGIQLNGSIYDVLLMARIEYNKHKSYSLDSCLKRIGQDKSDKVSLYIKDNKLWTTYNVIGKKLKEKDLHYERVPFDIMFEYGCIDVEMTLKLYEHQINYFNLPENIEQLRLVESNMELIKTVYAMESRGLSIDVGYCKYMQETLLKEHEELIETLEEIVGYPYKGGPIWLSKALTEQGIDVKLSAKGNAELDSDALEEMNNAVASLVSKIRENEKETGFYSTLIRHQVDGVIHTNYRVNGTDTMRFSSNEPNMQNIPACKKGETNTVRHAFKPRPGFKFVSIDYSAMEFRLCVDFAGELPMIAAIKEGLDPHLVVAENMGADRKAAKTLQFLTMYGGGAQKLADTLGCDLSKAKQLKNDYFRALPAVARLHRIVQDTAIGRGYLRSTYGMRYFLDDANYAYKILNHLIQGTGALIIREAMNKIAYILEGTKSKLVAQCHDELIIEVADDELDLIPMIKGIMEREWQPINGMNMQCDVAVSDTSWNENTFYKWEAI